MEDFIPKDPFSYEKERMPRYEAFAKTWGLKDLRTLVALYDIDELLSFLPPEPNSMEKGALQEIMGATTPSAYMDYQKSNNTFELIMQWQELTNNSHLTPPPFKLPDA